MKKRLCYFILSLALLANSAFAAQLNVFAAASLTNVLQQIGDAYKQQAPDTEIVFSFAGSSTLAKQIEQDAPADLFISADQKWMAYLAEKRSKKIAQITPLVQNELVLIAPQSSPLTPSTLDDFDWQAALGEGYLAVGDDNVPVGRYAKKALEYFGVWAQVSPKLAKAKDVRAVLAYVERGELPLGIVYATDANISRKVKRVATFPAASYGEIIYPAATVSDNPQAAHFLAFLTSPQAQQIFLNAGFKPLK
ncbi:molybdate ABC transporter substrate-binding protein [Muribacter muris]|uniref:Molybdate ABC transporter substrate-binding protein n=1 Tax=Muribacter muris TaxID=67855 RepID=A0A4Y9JWI4_9PAST|nr:molybdate ABC transporter substrate-binding protein [Muribacter muris]MBF0785729.1 molybdate ABC transporter substrate-binding protein [Muribacter muris]MBF0827764.1 molybdate ABC transporter substrate-binding protein [Muribacter muris]TFV08806.1 molybdate ABC transporter substrate-binding protein [Muribacter muris]